MPFSVHLKPDIHPHAAPPYLPFMEYGNRTTSIKFLLYFVPALKVFYVHPSNLLEALLCCNEKPRLPYIGTVVLPEQYRNRQSRWYFWKKSTTQLGVAVPIYGRRDYACSSLLSSSLSPVSPPIPDCLSHASAAARLQRARAESVWPVGLIPSCKSSR